MQKQPDDFLAETVDEQIEYLSHTENSTSASSVVQDLQELYKRGDMPEQVRRSLDTIWSRLADRLSPENQTLCSMPETGSLRALPRNELQLLMPLTSQFQASQAAEQGQAGHRQQMAGLTQRQAPGRSGKRNLRRTVALSALAALVLLSIVSWALVTHVGLSIRTGLGSGPGSDTVVPTIPPTPAPQSLRDQAHRLLSQFHQEVITWGRIHQYHDTFDGKDYALDYAYDQSGIGGVLNHMVDQAQSSTDFQAVISQIQDELTNLHAMESDAADKTPWNQVHDADSSLLNHYQLKSGTVVVVSLYEQSMRVYQDGQLIKAFQVTTGRLEVPSLPGSWQVMQRFANVTLKSSYPKGSPLWFAPTPVKYALEYHAYGYMIYGSWWRENYGIGTNMPHHDGSGNSSANNGSSGSVNLPESAMAWLYTKVQMNAPVVIY